VPERGPVTLREGDLDFRFDVSWQVCSQWDKEAVYSDLKGQASGSKGVDFVALRAGALYLIEVKDYRTSEQQRSTREKLADAGDPLADVVAAKVRDTVAGLVGAARMERDPAWRACVEPLVGREVYVVLWIEHAAVAASTSVQAKRAKVGVAATLFTSLKKRCRWLDARALVCSRSDDGPVPGLEVHSVAGAARMRGRRP